MMNARKVFYGMVAAVALLALLSVGITYSGRQLIIEQGDKLEKAKLDTAVANEKQNLIRRATEDIKEYEGLEQIAKSVVPQEKDQARTVLELVELARQSGIDIASVQFPSSELGAVTKKSKSSSSPSLARGSSTSDTELTQLTPVEGLKGVYEMTITITANPDKSITYNQLLDYLRRLENNRRTAQVSNISISPDEDNHSNVSFRLNLKSFVKP